MSSKTNFILIGGNGFLGSAFSKYLQLQGNDVTVIGRRELPIEEREDSTYFSINHIDLKRPERFLDASSNHVIIDFAYTSVPNTSYENPVKDFSENLLNVIQYLEFAKAIGAVKYVYVSSGGTVYGNTSNLKLQEDGANFPIAPYGITKLACERYVHMYCEVHDVPGVIVRPSNVYGPGQLPFRGQGLVATVMASIYKEQPVQMFGNGDTIRDFIYIDDLNKALFEILQKGEKGEIYNIGTGIGTSISDIVKQIEDVAAPYKIKEVVPLPSRPFDIKSNVLDCTKVRKTTGWQAETDLRTGLTNTWKWIQEYMKSH